ncbi:MAG: peptide deformylase [Candidatus Krumholzibacteria bacterium]|nr:peptide deformylase [Candidatus Krumholzibacteria bacterium]
MAVRDLLYLGNPKLYEESSKVKHEELEDLKSVIEDLADTLMEFRDEYGWGRAIAAPQIGVMKRIVYMHVNEPVVLINPVIKLRSRRKTLVWDNCMSCPDLLVQVKRYRRCKVEYRDVNWQKRSLYLEGKLATLMQHEVEHLQGILITQKAITEKSFALRSERAYLK